jgi:lipoprotein-anchoring transpeptidase ErfK/SrfK
MDMPKFTLSKLPPSLKYVSFFIAVLLALIAILGVGITYAYRDKYYPGVKVNGIAVGGMNRAEADAKVTTAAQAAAARKVVVAVPDISQPKKEDTGLYPVQTIETTGTDLGLSISPTLALSQAWGKGHGGASWQWIQDVTHLFFGGGESYTSVPALDTAKLHDFVTTKVVAAAVSPKPASIVVNGKNIDITDGSQGLAVDGDTLSTQLSAALTSTLDSDDLSFRIPPTLVDSPVTRTTVQPVADQLSTLGDSKPSLTADGVTLTPSRDELLQWFTPALSDAGEMSLKVNSDRITSYVQKNGSLLDVKKSSSAVVTAATNWLAKPVVGITVSLALKPSTAPTIGSYQGGLFEGKYIYVNLAEQKAYRITGDTVEKVYRVSTGKWSTPTPKGTFHVGSKYPRAYSREFGLYMPWWENLLGTADSGDDLPVGSYGLHELPEWPDGRKEGQGHLGTPVSHGCVRFGVGDAKEVYDWTDIGTPVVIQ